MFSHKFHLFVFDGSTFSIRGQLFHVGAVLAEFFIFFGIHAFTSGRITFEQTVYHHVGITADRRGEMRIIIEGQSVMTKIVGRVDRLSHRTDCKCFDQVLLFLSLNFIQKMVNRARHRRLFSGCAKVVTKFADELREVL
ncbi:hypothetical protein SDC9_204220 [bioreactor metagenome]|uniref:Uncharacterized protein n=1 Tax=bioreactor metagenome TaxID=1076179 RepID=A0A645J039_9ZZZZ